MMGVRWTPGFAAGVAYLGCLAFLPVPFWLIEVWVGGTLGGGAAGLLAFPICMVLAWLATRQPAWARANARPAHGDRPGARVVLMLLAALAALFAVLAQADRRWWMASGLLIPPFIFVWLWGVHGLPKARVLALPVGFGWFALPWEAFLRAALDEPLQAWTADIAAALLRLAGYPIQFWNDVTIYTYEFYVVVNETCSGMNMLVTLSMYTLLFGWVAQPRLRDRMYLMLLVFPLAMFANGVRVAVIYLLGHHGDQALAMGPWHYRTAYLVFLPMFWFLYVVNQALVRRHIRRRRLSGGRATGPGGADGAAG